MPFAVGAKGKKKKRRNSMKYIKKKKVLDAVFNGCGQCNEEIEDLSTLDVVLCKYCTHSHFDELHGEYWCHDAIEAKQVGDEDFCSRWEKKIQQ